MLFIYNSKETNVVHRTRMTIAKITGCHVVLGMTEALVDVATLTAQIQVSSPVKEIVVCIYLTRDASLASLQQVSAKLRLI